MLSILTTISLNASFTSLHQDLVKQPDKEVVGKDSNDEDEDHDEQCEAASYNQLFYWQDISHCSGSGHVLVWNLYLLVWTLLVSSHTTGWNSTDLSLVLIRIWKFEGEPSVLTTYYHATMFQSVRQELTYIFHPDRLLFIFDFNSCSHLSLISVMSENRY